MKFLKHLTLWLSLIMLIHVAYITYDGVTGEPGNAQVALVLGNKVHQSGVVSDRLKSRLDKTLELYNNARVKTVIVSGGVGWEGHDEAKVMRDYLVKRKVNPQDIIVDSTGSNTYLSAVATRRIMRERKASSVVVVSNYYHLTRSKLILRKMGISKVSAAHADFYEVRDIVSLLREVLAVYYYMIRY